MSETSYAGWNETHLRSDDVLKQGVDLQENLDAIHAIATTDGVEEDLAICGKHKETLSPTGAPFDTSQRLFRCGICADDLGLPHGDG